MRRLFAALFATIERTARNIGSGFKTMPLPPPKGESSTCLCLSKAKSRSCVRRMSSSPFSLARLMMLSPNTASNIAGKSVTMSIRTVFQLFL